jgi:hypothetical protein
MENMISVDSRNLNYIKIGPSLLKNKEQWKTLLSDSKELLDRLKIEYSRASVERRQNNHITVDVYTNDGVRSLNLRKGYSLVG